MSVNEGVTGIEGAGAFLQANDAAYRWSLDRISNSAVGADTDALMAAIVRSARFAATFHTGRFVDGTIENRAVEMGRGIVARLPEEFPSVSGAASGGRRRVLHVASHVSGIGGHTRLLDRWIRFDDSSQHSLVLTNQAQGSIPVWLRESIRGSGGHLSVLPGSVGLDRRASWVRGIARSSADVVLLHHGPFDIIPVMAFAEDGLPPVGMINHCDHQFWMGGGVADVVVSLRTAGAEHAAMRRATKNNAVLPVPLDVASTTLSRSEAREKLGIPDSVTVLLSVGRPEKYRPCGSFDFVSLAGEILDRHQMAHIFVVGETLAGIRPYLRHLPHSRLHFVGQLDDPSVYTAAADVYLESFPFGSQTALLEAALAGLPVVPAYSPLFSLLVANDDALQDVLPNPSNDRDYLERVDAFVRDKPGRRAFGEMLGERLALEHIGDGWRRRMAMIYERLAVVRHESRLLPETQCESSRADIGLSLWNVVADGKSSASTYESDQVIAVARHWAFVFKEVGNPVMASRLALRALTRSPTHLAAWRLLASTSSKLLGHVVK